MKTLLLLAGTSLFAATCPPVSTVQVQHNVGQTFVTWTDTGGADGRYKVWRDVSGSVTQIAHRLDNSGQMVPQGRVNFTAAHRQNSTKLMSTLGGAPLPFGTGLAVFTPSVAGSAIYGVSVWSVSGACTESGIIWSEPVGENPATIQPILQIPHTASTQNPSQYSITGTQRPLWFKLNASGASWVSRGDVWQLFGDSTMGWYPGIQQAWSVWEDKAAYNFSPVSLVFDPSEAVWTFNGTTYPNIETRWIGYYVTPLSGGSARVYPYTERWLNKALTHTLASYNADPNRIYMWGKSMGAWGGASWALHRADVFAAIFLHQPKWRSTNTSGTWYAASLPNQGDAGAANFLMDDGTPFTQRYDQVLYLANCANSAPPVVWGIGKADGYSPFSDHIQALAAMQGCYRPHHFKWTSGNHSTDDSINQLKTEYQQVYRKNVSYPAFAASSLDDLTTAASGCVNCGWQWTIKEDSADKWEAWISNNNNTAGVQVIVTPHNLQNFTIAPGEHVLVNGVPFTADSFGRVSTDISIPAYGTHILAITKTGQPPPPAQPAAPTNPQVSISIVVSWADAVNPLDTTYKVSRKFGLCSAPGTFTEVANSLVDRTFLDTDSGPAQRCYRVVAVGPSLESAALEIEVP